MFGAVDYRIFSSSDAQTAGVPVPLVQVSLGEAGAQYGPGASGEVFVRGPNVFQGYLTAEGVVGNPEGGWFASGDLGEVTANGELRIVGRAKDVIIRSGHNIDPQMIEEAALGGLFAWFIWANFYAPWWRLVDDRVIKAPSALLSILEDSAELEMHRDSEGQQWTRFVRFSADCPICSGRVLLMPGKPDQALPIVGRCIESPYSHVYSFDRVRLSGTYLGCEVPMV